MRWENLSENTKETYMLDNIRIILVEPSHPGNIGAAARAMKTMGLSKLYLVAPELFPHVKANEMAAGALDVLGQAVVVPTLKEAIQDCHLVMGASARSRTIPWPTLTPRECAVTVIKEPSETQIALLFGREQSGLTNEELHQCHYHVHIPSHPDYSSLNLAAAVQVITYELRMASLGEIEKMPWDQAYADQAAHDAFYEALEKILIELDFLKASAPRQLMTRLRRLFNRTRLDVMEMNILRGILKAISDGVKPREN